MFVLNNQPIQIDTPFTHNEIQYPANWLRLSTPQDRRTIGIVEVADPQPYDDRFYWGPGNPKDLGQLKQQFISQVNTTVWNLLLPTDFMDSRKANDPSYSAPSNWLEWRAAIRVTASTAKQNILAANSVEELAPVAIPVFPASPV